MFRSSMIYLSKAPWARQMVTHWAFAWRAASRFVAGEKLEDAVRVVGELNFKGINATLDHLGENTTNPEESKRATLDILKIVDAIAQKKVRANVSIKLTQIGLSLDYQLCTQNLQQILTYAQSQGIFVRLDMEDSSYVDRTLAIYCQMHEQDHFENIGVVFQSYLYRTREDLKQLLPLGTRVRLCKGAYKEPPDIAFPKKKDVDNNYDLLAEMLIDSSLANQSPPTSEDGKIPPIPAIASHDPLRIENAKNYAKKVGLPKKALEFQMLYGIRRDLQEQLVKEGYPVRVYVPYGIEWYPYYVRRLAERPSNLWFFVSNYFRK